MSSRTKWDRNQDSDTPLPAQNEPETTQEFVAVRVGSRGQIPPFVLTWLAGDITPGVASFLFF